MKNTGYWQAVERLAYELMAHIGDVAADALKSGDLSEWEELGYSAETKMADPQTENGQRLLHLEEIMWTIHKTYDVPMFTIEQDLDIAQKQMIAKMVVEDLWNDFEQ